MAPRVTILGCGPAGLLAAHAAVQAGLDPVIYSVKKASVIHGAQYLHDHIPGLTDKEPDGMLSYTKLGTREGYAAKVYGDPDAPVSWDVFKEGDHPAWRMIEIYDELRRLYWPRVYNRVIGPEDIGPIADGADLTLCTLPASELCQRPAHKFDFQRVTISDRSQLDPSVENAIVYNGTAEDRWYRTSSIFGHDGTEWSSHRGHPIGEKIVGGIKPLRTDCTCHYRHSDFYRLGRFGQWEKGVLVSDAYKDAVQLVGNVS